MEKGPFVRVENLRIGSSFMHCIHYTTLFFFIFDFWHANNLSRIDGQAHIKIQITVALTKQHFVQSPIPWIQLDKGFYQL